MKQNAQQNVHEFMMLAAIQVLIGPDVMGDQMNNLIDKLYAQIVNERKDMEHRIRARQAARHNVGAK